MNSSDDLELRAAPFTLVAGERRGLGMDTGQRRSGATVATPTVNEEFWALVDASWSRDDIEELVALWKAMEDAYTRQEAARST
jgi:hypothetical protein